jgi:hypothetical protein
MARVGQRGGFAETTITTDDTPWVSFSAAARKYGVDTRTVIKVAEEHPDDIAVLWFTPLCARINLNDLDRVLRTKPVNRRTPDAGVGGRQSDVRVNHESYASSPRVDT